MAGFGKGDWGLKLLSALLAVILWVYVANDQNPTQEQEINNVPVEVRGLGSDLAVSELPGSVNLRVQGTTSMINALTSKAIEVFVDLRGVGPGRKPVSVQVKPPDGIKVTDLSPQTVSVTLEPLVEKQVPVRTRTTGSLNKGYKVLNIKSKPDEVILRGPKGILDNVSSVLVNISLKGKARSFGETVPVKVSAGAGSFLEERVVKRTPPVVDILVSVGPDLPTRKVQVAPALTGEPAKGYNVSMTVVDPPELVITGEQTVIGKVYRIVTQPVNISGANKDIYVDISPQLPPGVVSNRQSLRVLVKIGKE